MAAGADQVRGSGELAWLAQAGVVPGYLLSGGRCPPEGCGIGPSCLSQWWPAQLSVNGILYQSAEHYVMSQKALLRAGSGPAAQIRQRPEAARRPSWQAGGVSETAWLKWRAGIILTDNLAKFSQDPGTARLRARRRRHTVLRGYGQQTNRGRWPGCRRGRRTP